MWGQMAKVSLLIIRQKMRAKKPSAAVETVLADVVARVMMFAIAGVAMIAAKRAEKSTPAVLADIKLLF